MALDQWVLPIWTSADNLPQLASSLLKSALISSEGSEGIETKNQAPLPLYFQHLALNLKGTLADVM